MTVIYFTATGNSLSVAKRLGKQLISATELQHRNSPIEISDPEGIGFVMPVYFGQPPLIVSKLMVVMRLRTPYLFAVLTYGELAGRAASHVSRLSDMDGRRFDYVRTIKMVDNNFTIVNVRKQVETCGRKKIPAYLEEIAGEIDQRKRTVEKPGLFGKIVGMVSERMAGRSAFDDGFSVDSSKCNGCGTCTKVCPVNNVSLTQEGHPQWLGHCLKCTACYHNCPQAAIRYRGEHSHYCFRNPSVSLAEIIKANHHPVG